MELRMSAQVVGVIVTSECGQFNQKIRRGK